MKTLKGLFRCLSCGCDKFVHYHAYESPLDTAYLACDACGQRYYHLEKEKIDKAE